jgi:hypothetical protein
MGTGVVVAQTDAQVRLRVDLSETPPTALACHIASGIAAPQEFESGYCKQPQLLELSALCSMESWRVEKSFWGSTLLDPVGSE